MCSRASVPWWGVTAFVLFPVVAGGLCPGATAAPAGAPGEEQISADALRRQLTFVASPEFEGRESASRGGRAAARYLALQFGEAGLEAIGPSHLALDAAAPSFYQPFNVVKFHWDAQSTVLQVRRSEPAETVRTYRMVTDFIPYEFPGEIEITAPVVFAGYGITAPALDYDDYAGLDARGKIVLAFDHEPQEAQADSRWGGLVHTREAAIEWKVRNAQAHGAAALLVMPEPEPAHKDTWTLSGEWFQSFVEREQQALEETTIQIPSLIIKPRLGRDLLAAAGRRPEAIQHEIDARGRSRSFPIPDITMALRLSTKEARTAVTANVIGLLRGSDAALGDEVVIVSAHYDHDGVVGKDIYLGADDDGSGTVCVLEMARAMADSGRKPRRSVLFAVWGAEEKGLFGSEFYASRPYFPLERTAAVIQLDMVGRDEAPVHADQVAELEGRDTRNLVNLLGTPFSPELRALAARLNEGLGLELDYRFDRDIEENLFTRSDQWPFALRDVPSLFFSTGLHPDYHQTADSAIKINYKKMERIARLAYRAAWAIADADERPGFNPIPAQGE